MSTRGWFLVLACMIGVMAFSVTIPATAQSTGTTTQKTPRYDVTAPALSARAPGNWIKKVVFQGGYPITEQEPEHPVIRKVVAAELLQGLFDILDQLLVLFSIAANNLPPDAVFTFTPAVGTVGTPVNFDASATTDPNTDLLQYSWDFGDGALGTHSTVSHTYTAAGTYNVTLTVKDIIGATDALTQAVTVNPAP